MLLCLDINHLVTNTCFCEIIQVTETCSGFFSNSGRLVNVFLWFIFGVYLMRNIWLLFCCGRPFFSPKTFNEFKHHDAYIYMYVCSLFGVLVLEG